MSFLDLLHAYEQEMILDKNNMKTLIALRGTNNCRKFEKGKVHT